MQRQTLSTVPNYSEALAAAAMAPALQGKTMAAATAEAVVCGRAPSGHGGRRLAAQMPLLPPLSKPTLPRRTTSRLRRPTTLVCSLAAFYLTARELAHLVKGSGFSLICLMLVKTMDQGIMSGISLLRQKF